ncbi:Dabb family protein [Ktedonobacteria bacterium brp13]|nr:Dabb family protein [Ktedonobacteria bacterium brp13]
MITHVVLVQPKENTTSAEMETLIEQIRALKELIPAIQSIQVGKNVGRLTQGYTYGLIAQFASEEKLKEYLTHPAHQALARELLQQTQIIEFDLAH